MPEAHSSCSTARNINNMYETTIIAVQGDDAFSFLQGQLSNDLVKLESMESIRAAWCNPKGRVITLMTVSKTGDGYSLEVPAELGSDIIKRLTMFRFRAKVEFTKGAAAPGPDLVDTIEAGLPWVGAEQSEKFTPHMLNLDLLGAISLDKGCYTGQEIVARTHYKGATKRRLVRFNCAGPVAAGDRVSDGEREIGDVLNTAENKLLAIVPTARADDALFVNGAALERQALPYALD